MHHGLDSKFYLSKGFRVVAVEANPSMVAFAERNLSSFVECGQLTIVERALWSQNAEQITFYLNAVKEDWSSGFQTFAEKEGHVCQQIVVNTITLSELFQEFGVPYYIKCDIEGADRFFVQQLRAEAERPVFVSVEALSLSLLVELVAAGYDRVQIVNQALNALVAPPKPAREGNYFECKFNGHMSGLFGLELAPERWLDFQEAAERYLNFKSLKQRDDSLAHGWLDFHVTTQDALKH